MWPFSKKKVKQEELKTEIEKIGKKLTAQTNGMVTKVEAIKENKIAVTVKYVIGDRKLFATQEIDTAKYDTSELDVGEVIVIAYNPQKPEEAAIKDLETL